MGGEFFREAGVLVTVLSPLESLVSHGRLTLAGIVVTVVVSGLCLGVGFWAGVEQE
jgi:hypothetical protein